jgi:hypothetical protein
MQGRFSHEKELRKGALRQLRASSTFNLGLILALVEHAAKSRLQVAASVAEAVEHLDLDPAKRAAAAAGSGLRTQAVWELVQQEDGICT